MTQVSSARREGDFVLAARWTALIAAGVCIFIVTMLAMSMWRDWKLTPLNSPEVASLKAQLQEKPNDEQIKELLRRRDMELRSGYFARSELAKRGAWLLVAAAGALVIAMKSHSALTRRPAALTASRTDIWQDNRLARIGVAVSGVTLLVVCGALVALGRPALPERESQSAAALPPASAEQLAKEWVSFRGMHGDGTVNGAIPDKWDGTTGDGVIWKTEMPLPGHSSPIVFGGNVFVTGSDGNLQELLCFDAATGSRKWRGTVPRGTLQNPNTFEDTGWAAPTPVTDGGRAYAIFATGDLAAFDYSGRRVWAKSVGTPDSAYGFASSLAIHGGHVIVQWDQGTDAEGGKSFLFCFDGITGQQVWKTARPVANSWSSPIVVGDVIYTTGNPWVMANDARTGKEIWRARLLEGDVACSPVLHDGVLYVANDRGVAAAIRVDGSGDVTETKVLWKNSDVTLPDMVSPLASGKYVLLVHGGGEMNCLDAATGKVVWNHNLDAMVHASPVLAGNTVVLFDTKGIAHLFGLADKFEEKWRVTLGDEVTASPALVNGRMYVRGKEHLYCIGKK